MSKHGDFTNGNIRLRMAQLQAAAHANEQDATLWRWFSDQMEDQTMRCERKKGDWIICVAGRELARDPSFDLAVRAAYILCRALRAL
ncbi:hypothetical protein PHO31112_00873 [Pandoraea horticolens]|uniref:Uncharacterized protein n=1 Tax=Pandoraea horticolens TaxID=2508298 RepID=A0A5E4SLC1_9BURK|nr:hypothetical protein [Pandoraea horticolens]VVD76497.1 hypothetical protein PHO31112_00873 [Pandoraea horticolens]